MQKVRIKRIDKTLPLPVYETHGAVGFDVLAREDTTIGAKELSLVPGNLVVAIPEGYMLALASRSSTPRKKGLLTPHGFGVIDQDYCGNNDELLVQVYNFQDEEVTVKRGERIAQGVFVRVDQFEFDEVDDMETKDRGGFGTTGQ